MMWKSLFHTYIAAITTEGNCQWFVNHAPTPVTDTPLVWNQDGAGYNEMVKQSCLSCLASIFFVFWFGLLFHKPTLHPRSTLEISCCSSISNPDWLDENRPNWHPQAPAEPLRHTFVYRHPKCSHNSQKKPLIEPHEFDFGDRTFCFPKRKSKNASNSHTFNRLSQNRKLRIQ